MLYKNTVFLTGYARHRNASFEDGGRPLARHRLAFPQTAYEGRFTFKEAWCPVLRRHVQMAPLSNPEGADVLPPLYDANLVYFEGGEGRVAGLELDTLNGKFTAQTWALKIAALGQR